MESKEGEYIQSLYSHLPLTFLEPPFNFWKLLFCSLVVWCLTVLDLIGTGQFLFSELMKYYRERGIKKFFFGQVAPAIDESNRKFSEGISNFKRGFGTEEIESSKKIYILKPFKNKLWEILLTMKK